MDEEIDNSKQEIENDILDEIFVEKNISVDKKLLVEILKPFVSIDEEGTIDFTDDYENLAYWQKILIYLVSKKAMMLKGNIEKEYAGPKEISEKAFIGESAAKKIANNEIIARIVKKTSEGYFIPNYNLRKIKELILKNGN